MLTNSDIEVLMKALDAYKGKAANSAIMTIMLGAMFSKKDEHEQWEKDANKTMENAKLEADAVEETVILLKAKLIQMRDRATVEEATAYLKAG